MSLERVSPVCMDVCERLASLGQAEVVSPRLLVMLAHPDDEVLAVGGRLEWLTTVRFVGIMDGVPVDGADARAHGFAGLAEYGAARRAELAAALRMAGLNPACARPLQVTGGRVLSDQGAAFELVELARAVAREVLEFRPEAVLTHPYEGGHPDHDACAFAVHAAVRISGLDMPLVEAPFYHAGAYGIETGVFVSGDPGFEARLSAEQAAKKRAHLACFRSQAETLGLFGVELERYRVAPSYDFGRPPHEGQLYYERYPWGTDGNCFCELSDCAAAELGL